MIHNEKHWKIRESNTESLIYAVLFAYKGTVMFTDWTRCTVCTQVHYSGLFH